MNKTKWILRIFLITIVLLTFMNVTSRADSNLKDVNDSALTGRTYVNARSAYLETIKLYNSSVNNSDYVIIDINKDGNPELIVRTGTNDSNYNYHFYTFNISDLTYLESVSGVHTTLYEMEDEKYIYALYAHMNYEQVTLYGLNDNNKLVKKVYDTRKLKDGESHIGGDKKIEFVSTSDTDYLYNNIKDLTDDNPETTQETPAETTVEFNEPDTTEIVEETNETDNPNSFTNEISEELSRKDDTNTIEEKKKQEKISYAEYMSNRKQMIIYGLIGVIVVLVLTIYIMSKKKK